MALVELVDRPDAAARRGSAKRRSRVDRRAATEQAGPRARLFFGTRRLREAPLGAPALRGRASCTIRAHARNDPGHRRRRLRRLARRRRAGARRATRRSSSTISATARRRCARASRRSPAGRSRASRPTSATSWRCGAAFHDHPIAARHPLRRAEGRRRVGGAAARLLRRQRRRHARAGRGDGRGGRRDAGVQLVGERLRPRRRSAGERGRAAAAANVYGRTKRVVEDFLRDLCAGQRELADRASCASSIPRARIRRACSARRRAGARRTSSRCCAAWRPARRRADDLWRRLGHGRRHRRARLHARAGPRRGLTSRRCAIVAAKPGAMHAQPRRGKGYSVLERDRGVRARVRTRDSRASIGPRRAGRRRGQLRRRGDARHEIARTGVRRAISMRSAPTRGAGRRTAAATDGR